MSISPVPSVPAQNPFFAPAGPPKARLVQNGFTGLTTAETSRLFLRIIGIGAIGAGTFALGAAAFGFTAGAVGLLVIPCGVLSAGSLWYSLQFDDYENPEELEKFQREAARKPLEQVVRQHGWNSMLHWGLLTPDQFEEKFRHQMRGKNLIEIISECESTERHIAECLRPRYDYRLPPPSEWRRQWAGETASKTFEEILLQYPLDKLEKYNILEVGELHKIKELKDVHDRIKQECDDQKAQIELEFASSTEVYLRSHQADCAAADRAYNEHEAVRRLSSFDMEYVRERQRVQDTANSKRTLARENFERAIRPITGDGQISYGKLSPEQKAAYDRLEHVMQVQILEADNEAREKIAQVDARFAAEKARLLSEEREVKKAREDKINESKIRFDAAILPYRMRKEERLAPLDARFHSAVSDLNGRYRAYLRTIGAAR